MHGLLALQILRAIFIALLAWLNLLCLDAPLVAVGWQGLFAVAARVELPGPTRLALFLTAWLIYLIDRLVDSFSLPMGVGTSARQIFCVKHRHFWIGLIAVILVADCLIVCTKLDYQLVRRGITLGALAAGYLTVNIGFGTIWKIIPMKEICIGLLFATGTLLALVHELGRPTLAFSAILFATLCILNCISIAFWERDLDLAQNKHSIATSRPDLKFAAKIVLIVVTLAGGAIAIFDASTWRVGLCLGVSALLLFGLDYLPVNRDQRTALADLLLLTPFVVFAFKNIM